MGANSCNRGSHGHHGLDNILKHTLKYAVILALAFSLILNAGCVEKYVNQRLAGNGLTGGATAGAANDTDTLGDEGCPQGYKECGNACISEESCCDNDDCDTAEECIDFECASTKPDHCGYLMEWDGEKGSCACLEGAKWCESQGKCIPELKCCSKFDCSRRGAEYCPLFYTSMRICVENGVKSCKYVSELKNQKNFDSEGENILVSFDRIFEEGIADFTINNETFNEVIKGERMNLGNVSVFFDELKELGGTCQAYD
jgi:hypothetical protein